MSNVIEGHFHTTLDINPNNVLNGAMDKLDFVLVIGIDKDGFDYIASSTSDKAKLLMALETVKFKLLRGDYD